MLFRSPEHTEERVLHLMRKPPFALFERLNADFHRICDSEGLPYQLIPYFISSHPGCTEQEMRALSQKVLGKLHFTLEQVQDLTPTPMTLSSVMFRTGENPYTREKVYVARSQEEKRRQKSYFFAAPKRDGERNDRKGRADSPHGGGAAHDPRANRTDGAPRTDRRRQKTQRQDQRPQERGATARSRSERSKGPRTGEKQGKFRS